MKSGITRFSLGEYNQSKIDDVWNKARDIYVETVDDTPVPVPPPPASGVMPNSLNVILGDMTESNDRAVSNMTSSYSQFWEATQDAKLLCDAPELQGVWTKTNLWIEIGEGHAEGDWTSCQAGKMGGNTTNTLVEMSFGDMWALDGKSNNNWYKIINDQTNGGGTNTIQAYKDRDGVGCECCGSSIMALWDSYPGFETSQWTSGDGIKYPDRCEYQKSPTMQSLLNPQYGRRFVGGPAGNPRVDINVLEGLYGCVWFRLVKMDEDGEDDRHLSRSQVTISADVKDEAGQTYSFWSVGGMSKHKLVPGDGSWMPMNFCLYRDDVVSIEKLTANPPPFPTQPKIR